MEISLVSNTQVVLYIDPLPGEDHQIQVMFLRNFFSQVCPLLAQLGYDYLCINSTHLKEFVEDFPDIIQEQATSSSEIFPEDQQLGAEMYVFAIDLTALASEAGK